MAYYQFAFQRGIIMSGKTLGSLSCLFALMTALLLGCDSGDDSAIEKPTTSHTQVGEAQLSEAERQRISAASLKAWKAADPVLTAAVDNAQQLHVAVNNLLKAPTAEALSAARHHWRETALTYQPFNLYGSLAELQPEQFHQLRQLIYAIAARPIQPGYLDNFGPYTYSGLVHDIGITISPETLREQHGMTDAQDAALGLYAVQFMLFGYSDAEPRQVADFVTQELTAEQRQQGFNNEEELPENRRRQLVRTEAQLLVDDLQRLQQLWQLNTDGSLAEIFTAYSPLQQHSLWVRAARLELSEIITELGKHHTASTTKTTAGAPAKTVDLDIGDTSFANRVPIAFLAARTQQLYGLAQTLQMSTELQENLKRGHQLLNQLKSQNAAKGASESVITALTQALDLMVAAQDGDIK